MSEKKTQLARIEEILEEQGYIDNFSAIHQRISLRLGARIQDLEDRGFVFRTERRSDKNYVYYIVSRPGAAQLAIGV